MAFMIWSCQSYIEFAICSLKVVQSRDLRDVDMVKHRPEGTVQFCATNADGR